MILGNARTLGKHRRLVIPSRLDPQSVAACVTPQYTQCMSALCPRHFPANYASHMARHATDSI